jgi:hypothetical protein
VIRNYFGINILEDAATQERHKLIAIYPMVRICKLCRLDGRKRDDSHGTLWQGSLFRRLCFKSPRHIRFGKKLAGNGNFFNVYDHEARVAWRVAGISFTPFFPISPFFFYSLKIIPIGVYESITSRKPGFTPIIVLLQVKGRGIYIVFQTKIKIRIINTTPWSGLLL